MRAGGAVSCGPVFPDGARGTGVKQANLGQSVTDGRTMVRGLTDARYVGGSGATRCALRVSGTVSCWGQNLYRGNLTYAGQGEITTPVAVPGITGAIDLDVSHGSACVVVATGEVRCWGSDSYGEASGVPAGGGTPPDAKYADHPVTVTGIPAARDVALGGYLTCIAAVNGSVWCWGLNGDGGFGTGTQHDSDDRRAPLQVPGITGATAVAASGSKVCALSSGDVWCWGRFSWRDSDLTSQERVDRAYATPTKVPGATGAVELAIGTSSACARTAAGTVACWGDNAFGQLGALARRSAAALPVRGLTDATRLSIQSEDACALRATGDTVCWGVNASVRAVDPAARVTSTTTAVTARGITDAVELGVAAGHWCALLPTAVVRCVGLDMAGPREETLGIDSSGPAPASSPELTSVDQMTTGSGHSCFRVADRVRCFGLGHTLAEEIETWNTGGAGALTGITQIAGGRAHVCARTSDAAVWCWGEQNAGQILFTPRAGALNAAAKRSTSDVVEIVAAGDRNCARSSAGQVVCWGAGSGAEGVDSNVDTTVTLPAPATGLTVVGGRTCATFVSLPTSCFGPAAPPVERLAECALQAGTVRCVGDGASGMLGVGSEQFTRWRSIPVAQIQAAVVVELPVETPDPQTPQTPPADNPPSPAPGQVVNSANPPVTKPRTLRSAKAWRKGRTLTLRLLIDPGTTRCVGTVKVTVKSNRGRARKAGQLTSTAAGCGATVRVRLPRRARGTTKVTWATAGVTGTLRARV